MLKLREKKEHEARYAEIIAEHPEVQYQLPDAPTEKPVAVPAASNAKPQQKPPEE